MEKKKRQFVIGIDGATFRVIGPMIEQGRLPNIKALMEAGASAKLLSTIPPLSPVAWTSISTGASPARHGILDFIVFDQERKATVFYDATMRKVRPIWSVLSDLGRRVCVVNVPMTYPVDAVNGFMISGLGTPPTKEGFFHPRDRYEELQRATGGYKIDINVREGNSDYRRIQKSLVDVMDRRLAAFRFLLKREPWDFFMFVFTTTDRAQHFFWKFADPAHPAYDPKLASRFGGTIADLYEKVDGAVGEARRNAGPDDTIVLVSDHGFGPLQKKFSLARWMLDHGYLALRPHKGGPSRLLGALRRLVPAEVVHFLVRNIFTGRVHARALSGLAGRLDLERTQAFAHKKVDAFFIYLNDRATGGRSAAVAGELREALLLVRDPDTGEPVFRDVVDGPTQYDSRAAVVPALVAIPHDGYGISFDIASLPEAPLFEGGDVWSGTHTPDGIFVIAGPGIARGRRLDEIPVTDVAPTLYALAGVPLPRSVTGTVIRQCFSGEVPDPGLATEAADAGVESGGVLSEKESEEVAKRLRDLGYL